MVFGDNYTNKTTFSPFLKGVCFSNNTDRNLMNMNHLWNEFL